LSRFSKYCIVILHPAIERASLLNIIILLLYLVVITAYVIIQQILQIFKDFQRLFCDITSCNSPK
jgi:hypothetical protein